MLSAKVGKKSLNKKGDRGLSTSQSDLFGRKCRRFFGSHSENMAWFGFPAFYPYNLCGYFPGIFSIARYFTGKADAGIDKSIWRPAKPRKRATTRIRKTVARLRSKRIVANSQVKELPKMSNILVNKKCRGGGNWWSIFKPGKIKFYSRAEIYWHQILLQAFFFSKKRGPELGAWFD